MKTLSTILTLSIALFFSSCKKEAEVQKREIKGVVVHTITRQPLADQLLILKLTESWSSSKKDPEFPNGTPVFRQKTYTTRTDANGRFSFSVVTAGSIVFSIALQSEEYIQSWPPVGGFLNSGYNPVVYPLIRMYDTIYAERPAFIRYSILNTGNAPNDTLFLQTPYMKKSITVPTPQPIVFNGIGSMLPMPAFSYNWRFAGPNINETIIDTVPGESLSKLLVEWVHKRTDTVIHVRDSITVLPLSITNYPINY